VCQHPTEEEHALLALFVVAPGVENMRLVVNSAQRIKGEEEEDPAEALPVNRQWIAPRGFVFRDPQQQKRDREQAQRLKRLRDVRLAVEIEKLDEMTRVFEMQANEVILRQP